MAEDPLPVDRPLLPEPVMKVTDYDPVQACLDTTYDEAEKRRAACRSKRGPHAPCAQRVFPGRCRPHGHHGPTVIRRPDAAAVRRALMARAAAYQACYRDALRRRPGAAVKVTVSLAFSEVGLPHAVRGDTDPSTDPALVRCLARAFADVQLPRFPRTWRIVVKIPLAFRPGRAPAP